MKTSLPFRPRLQARRFIAAAVFALQATVAFSWLAEPARANRVDVHADQPGTPHAGLHDEATCPVCAVRLSHVAPAPSNEPAATASHGGVVLAAAAIAAPTFVSRGALGSRAPPAVAS